jgi:hypothetical protein
MSECGGFQPIHSKNISGVMSRTFQVRCTTDPSLGKVNYFTAETSMQNPFKARKMQKYSKKGILVTNLTWKVLCMVKCRQLQMKP